MTDDDGLPTLTVCATKAGGVSAQAQWTPEGRLALSGDSDGATDIECVAGEDRAVAAVAGGRFSITLPMPVSGLVRLSREGRVRALVYVSRRPRPLIPPEGGVSPLATSVLKLARKWELPGLSIHDQIDGGAGESACAGPADTLTERSIDPSSRFRVGSLSKLVTAILAHILVDQGRIDPTARVSTYLPIDLGPITVSDLLSNRSGLDLEIDGAWPFIDSDTLEESVEPSRTVPNTVTSELLARAKPEDGARVGFRYLTANYWILGRIAESVTDRAYVELARRHVFEPAGIEAACLGASFPDRRAPGEVTYHDRTDALKEPTKALQLADRVPSAYAACVSQRDAMGGWVLSAPELCRLAAHANGLLGSDRARLAFWGGDGGGIPAGPWRWGQGCFLQPSTGSRDPTWWVFGGVDGACGIVARPPGRTIAVLSNGTPPDRDLFLAALWRTIHRETQRGPMRK